jgi:hypothetical protein
MTIRSPVARMHRNWFLHLPFFAGVQAAPIFYQLGKKQSRFLAAVLARPLLLTLALALHSINSTQKWETSG